MKKYTLELDEEEAKNLVFLLNEVGEGYVGPTDDMQKVIDKIIDQLSSLYKP